MRILLVLFAACSVAGAVQPSEFFGATNRDAYIDWHATSSFRYSHVVYAPATADTGAAIHWSIVDDSIHLAVAVRATGWAGFGLAEAGAMPGSDMVLYTAAADSVTDAHVKDQLEPITDDCQDWSLINSRTGGGFLIFEVVRALDTGDPQDRAIVNDAEAAVLPHRVISAWGDTEQVLYHGPQSRVKFAVRLFGEPDLDELEVFRRSMSTAAEGSFDVRAVNYPVKTVETEYANFCASVSNFQDQGVPGDIPLHVVGIEPIVDQAAVRHVHHFVVYGRKNDIQPWEGCFDDASEVAYAWAPGEFPITFPANVGGPLGTNSGFVGFRLQIHYDNPLGISGVTDNSGVRFYYTSQLREHDMGVLRLGDPLVLLGGIRVGNGNGDLVKHSFGCPGTCTTRALTNIPSITIMREYLHMHATGKVMVNEQIRNGQVIRAGKVEFWDFDAQGNQGVRQREFEVRPGDSFKTTCYFSPDTDTRFGLGSSDEMCMAFLFYYPRIDMNGGNSHVCGYTGIPFCSGSWEQETVSDFTGLGRTFGESKGSCPVTPTPTIAPITLESTPTIAPITLESTPTIAPITLEPTPTIAPMTPGATSPIGPDELVPLPTSDCVRSGTTWAMGVILALLVSANR